MNPPGNILKNSEQAKQSRNKMRSMVVSVRIHAVVQSKKMEKWKKEFSLFSLQV